jgi:uncharacterized protein YndB with AHSA1/START domain
VTDPSDPDGPGPVGISVTRIFDSPPAEVWREWTEPDRFADWFGHPHADVPLEFVSMDVRVGGAWQLAMFVGPQRRRIDWRGSYLEVDAPRRLVLTMTDQPDVEAFALVTVELTDLGDGRTEMSFEQRGRMSREQFRAAESGWGGFFDRIAERVTRG